MLLEGDLVAKAREQIFYDLSPARSWPCHDAAPHQMFQMNRAELFPRSRRVSRPMNSTSVVSVNFPSSLHHPCVHVGLEAMAISFPMHGYSGPFMARSIFELPNSVSSRCLSRSTASRFLHGFGLVMRVGSSWNGNRIAHLE